MALLELDGSLLSTLKDKVVVLTGGATGIGRETVRLFHGKHSQHHVNTTKPDSVI